MDYFYIIERYLVSVQMPRLAPTAVAEAAVAAARAARRFADIERAHERIEALRKKLVDLGYDAGQLGSIEMSLHRAHDILHQQIALNLQNGRRIGTDKEHDEVVA